jgi:hypothetical protein
MGKGSILGINKIFWERPVSWALAEIFWKRAVSWALAEIFWKRQDPGQ